MSPASAAPTQGHSAASTKRLLNFVLAIGIADLVLFLILIWVAFIDRSDAAISVIGPIHGIGFVALLGLTAYGAVEGRWGWWFPGITLITTGPPGSIVGDLILRRQLAERAAAGTPGAPHT
jgi:hypothetical protein